MTFPHYFRRAFAAAGACLAGGLLTSGTAFADAVTVPVTVPVQMSINIPNCTSPTVGGSYPNLTITCGGGVPITNPTTCAVGLITSPAPLTAAGGTVYLFANTCNQAVSSWSWTRNGVALASGASVQNSVDSIPANTSSSAINYTYTLTVNTGTSTQGQMSISSISVPGSGTGNPNPGGITCAGFSKTLVIDVPWVSTTSNTRYLTSNYGGFGSNDAVVYRMTVPANAVSTSYGSITSAEYGLGGNYRTSVLSTTACDFDTSGQQTVYNVSLGNSLGYSLQVGGSQQAWITMMQPGVTYYLNVKNYTPSGQATCPAGTQCNMFLDFATPPGT